MPFRHVFCAVALAGCLPATDLGRERGGPQNPLVTLVEPAPGGSAPRNLAAVVLRLASGLREEPSPPHARVRPEGGGPGLALGPAAPLACTGPGRCYAFTLPEPLPAGGYLAEGPPATLDDGRPLPAITAGWFAVGDADDSTPPVLSPVTLETEGPCLRARFATDEPARAVVSAGGDEVPAGEAATSFDVVARLREPIALPVIVRAIDWAGNRVDSPPAQLSFPAVPPLAITELLPNPAGPEATQEFVEIVNTGADPVPLDGLVIEDAGGADPLPPLALGPGAFALIVAGGFDAGDGRDVAARPGTTLLRVEGRIGRDGLGNAGEPVKLRRRTGEVVSRYGGWVNTSATAWVGRSVQRSTPDACDHPHAWSTRPRMPSPGW